MVLQNLATLQVAMRKLQESVYPVHSAVDFSIAALSYVTQSNEHSDSNLKCTIPGCNRNIQNNRVCITYGIKRNCYKIEGCSNKGPNNSSCFSRCAKMLICPHPSYYTNMRKKGRKCIPHGKEKRVGVRKCKFLGCKKESQRQGLSHTHSSIKK